jgi:hypothetical protein
MFRCFLAFDKPKMRLAFSQRFGDRDQDWWRDVIFSDEKTFR